jgi:hypothetical protein
MRRQQETQANAHNPSKLHTVGSIPVGVHRRTPLRARVRSMFVFVGATQYCELGYLQAVGGLFGVPSVAPE